MKKIFTVFMVMIMVLSLAGCGGTEESVSSDKSADEGSDVSKAVSQEGSLPESGQSAVSSGAEEAEKTLIPLGEWADIYDSKGLKQVRITNVTWDNEAGKAMVDEYNSKSTMIEIQSLVDDYSDLNYYVYEYEVRYPKDYPLENENMGIYFFSIHFDGEKDESGWYTKDNTYIVGVNSTYDLTDIGETKVMPGDTVKGKGFGTMIDQYKDEFYLSVSYKDPADGEDADYKEAFLAIK